MLTLEERKCFVVKFYYISLVYLSSVIRLVYTLQEQKSKTFPVLVGHENELTSLEVLEIIRNTSVTTD